MSVTPRLADVKCSRLQFFPGDRLLVKVNHILHKKSRDQLRKSVERWAGDHVEVLIVELPLFDVEIIRAEEQLRVGNTSNPESPT